MNRLSDKLNNLEEMGRFLETLASQDGATDRD